MVKKSRLIAAVGALASSSFVSRAAAQTFECPSTGDTCAVSANEMRLQFNGVGAGNDTIVLGTMSYLFYQHLVACVNGSVQFATDSNGWLRDRLDQDSVLCADGGNDTVTVLRAGVTAPCSFGGFPVTLGAVNYDGKELKIHGGAGVDVLRGGDGTDRLCGGSGNDVLYGNGGRNELQGADGNDYLEASSDVDWMFGGAGDDTLIDNGTGGYRGDCSVSDTNRTPSRMEGGDGTDCLDVAPSTETGWCYRQEETCGGTTGRICHQGLWCGTGANDRMNTDSRFGVGCETRTLSTPCPRR